MAVCDHPCASGLSERIKGTPGRPSSHISPLNHHLPFPPSHQVARVFVCASTRHSVTMSGCGKPNCGCGTGCQCSDGCSCCKTLAVPSFGGLRNYIAENDCKCGPNCNCADCACHK